MIRIVLAAALGTALLLPLAPASAETEIHRDAARDVTRVTRDMKYDEVVATRPDPSNATADVVALRTTYGNQALKVTMSVRALAPASPFSGVFGGITMTTSGSGYSILFARRGPELVAELHRASGRSVECDGIGARVLGGRRAYQVTVPASCLDDPRWVRTSARLTYGRDSAQPDSWTDNARARGWQPEVVLGPRVHRG